MSIKSFVQKQAFPPPPGKVSISRILYWFEQVFSSFWVLFWGGVNKISLTQIWWTPRLLSLLHLSQSISIFFILLAMHPGEFGHLKYRVDSPEREGIWAHFGRMWVQTEMSRFVPSLEQVGYYAALASLHSSRFWTVWCSISLGINMFLMMLYFENFVIGSEFNWVSSPLSEGLVLTNWEHSPVASPSFAHKRTSHFSSSVHENFVTSGVSHKTRNPKKKKVAKK